MKNYKIPFKEILKIHLEDKSTKRFLVAVILSLAFSIAVILSTVALMDGYEKTLKNALRSQLGDYFVSSHSGFFIWDREVVQKILNLELNASPMVESEGYAIHQEESIGVLIRGVNDTYFKLFQQPHLLRNDEALIGKDLAQKFNLKIGDELPLMVVAHSDKEAEPLFISVKIKDIISSGLYEKDLRVLYVDEMFLRKEQKIELQKYNFIVFKDLNNQVETDYPKRLRILQSQLQEIFNLRPYYAEFDTMIKAVEVEKLSMTLILQIIVLVAIFNLFGFIVFLMEKKSQTFFLLRSFGLSLKQYKKFWSQSLTLVWMISCLTSLLFVKFFSWSLIHLNIFELPGDIYLMKRIILELNPKVVLIIFGLSYIWVLLLKTLIFWKFHKKSLSLGLKEGEA